LVTVIEIDNGENYGVINTPPEMFATLKWNDTVKVNRKISSTGCTLIPLRMCRGYTVKLFRNRMSASESRG